MYTYCGLDVHKGSVFACIFFCLFYCLLSDKIIDYE
jgi:hypothetical protein